MRGHYALIVGKEPIENTEFAKVADKNDVGFVLHPTDRFTIEVHDTFRRHFGGDTSWQSQAAGTKGGTLRRSADFGHRGNTREH